MGNKRYSSCRRLQLLATLIALLLGGCETAQFYTQATTGQLRILAARESIDDIAAHPDTEEALQRQLHLVQAIRAYAAAELQLPVGRAYGTFVKLERDFPLWNVFAAPELSLEPKRWCYPVAGCASYRGYFDKAQADAKAGRLRKQGYDVYLGPVPAYSTLGWFDDPILSSFVNWPPERLAGLLFHELAHRRVYIPGDTGFNESFATAVAEIALPDWRRRQGLPAQAGDPQRHSLELNRLMLTARRQLGEIYASEMADAQKRARKEQTLARLRHCYRRLSAGWDYPDRYRNYIESTNNATLALVAEYQSRVPAFVQLYRESGQNWPAFYTATERLGKLDRAARSRELKALAERNQDSGRKVTSSSFDGEACMTGDSFSADS